MLFIFHSGYGQHDTLSIKFDAKISDVETMGNKLEFVKVYIFKNNEILDSSLAQNGRFKYILKTGNVYKIEFQKKGYISKHLVISSKDPGYKTKNNASLKVEVSLFKHQNGLEVDFLETKPIGIAQYDEHSGKLKWNVDYTRMMVENIIRATLELYKKNNPEEN